MIKIDHTALYVRNLEAAKQFFVRFFGAQATPLYYNPQKEFRSYFLTFKEGSRLELMNRPEVNEQPLNLYRTGYAHLSFSVGGRENVDKLTRILSEAGYQLMDGPRTTGDGYYESCIKGIEGNLIEITE